MPGIPSTTSTKGTWNTVILYTIALAVQGKLSRLRALKHKEMFYDTTNVVKRDTAVSKIHGHKVVSFVNISWSLSTQT